MCRATRVCAGLALLLVPYTRNAHAAAPLLPAVEVENGICPSDAGTRHCECSPIGFVLLGEIFAAGRTLYSKPAAEALDARVGAGRLVLPGVEVDADPAYLSPTESAFVSARACRIGGVALDVAGKTFLPLTQDSRGKAVSAALRRVLERSFSAGKPGRFRWETPPPAHPAAASKG